jgi:small subunit ribosomal protein S5
MENKTQGPRTGAGAPRAFGTRGAARPGFGARGGDRKGGPSRGRDGRTGGRFERPKPEFDQKSIDVRRVARVVAGGRRFSFAVSMIIGDRKGKVGVGTGKAGDISMAMEKAVKDAKKHMIVIRTTKSRSIAHEVRAKSSSALIELRPAPSRGLVAGSAVRNVLELAGVVDVTAKVLSGSKNKLNIARATMKALSALSNRAPKSAKAEETVTATN